MTWPTTYFDTLSSEESSSSLKFKCHPMQLDSEFRNHAMQFQSNPNRSNQTQLEDMSAFALCHVCSHISESRADEPIHWQRSRRNRMTEASTLIPVNALLPACESVNDPSLSKVPFN